MRQKLDILFKTADFIKNPLFFKHDNVSKEQKDSIFKDKNSFHRAIFGHNCDIFAPLSPASKAAATFAGAREEKLHQNRGGSSPSG